MADQFLALVEEATRGTDPGSGYLYLPIMEDLQPDFNADDQPRKEFRGGDTALGDVTVVRRQSQWTKTITCAYYPGAAIGLLFKHLLGKAGTRSTVDTSGKEGILYPLAMPYGTGLELTTKAIGLWVVYDKDGVTKKRYYGGGRVKSATIKGEGTNDIMLTFELMGPGEYVGSEASNDLTPTFPAASPFVTADMLAYIGSGATRTGTAPNYTAIVPNTMAAFQPDSINITINAGFDDKTIINGVKGPSKTHRASQFSVEVTAPIDLSDPSSGFSPADEYDTIFAGASTNSLMLVLDNGELAGDATATYKATLDLPLMLRQHSTPKRNTDGSQPTIELKYTSLFSETTQYPLAIYTVDKAAAY